MTWNTFSRDPFQVQDRQIWPVFVDSLAQRQIKNQNTDTVWKTSKARLKHPPCIKTFLYKNNHKVANSYFPTWWDRLQPGINLDMCGADCGPAFRESIKLEVESCREKNRMLWSRQLNWAVGGTRSRTLTCPSAAHRSCPTQASGTKQDTHCGNSYLFFTWVSPWYSQYLTHNSSLLIPRTGSVGLQPTLQFGSLDGSPQYQTAGTRPASAAWGEKQEGFASRRLARRLEGSWDVGQEEM